MQANVVKPYFCHPCQKTIMVTYPNLLCPNCGSDFLQEAKIPDAAPVLQINPFLQSLSRFAELSERENPHSNCFSMILEGLRQNRGQRPIHLLMRELIERAENSGPASIERIQNIRSVHVENNENSECKICTECFTIGENKQVLECEHEYHDTCLAPWLKLKGNCPVCRQHI